MVDLTKGKKRMIVEPSKSVENEGSQKVQVLRKGGYSEERIAEVLLRGVPDESERGRADEADRFQSQADIDKPEVRVMVNPGGLNEKFANEKPDTCHYHRLSEERGNP